MQLRGSSAQFNIKPRSLGRALPIVPASRRAVKWREEEPLPPPIGLGVVLMQIVSYKDSCE